MTDTALGRELHRETVIRAESARVSLAAVRELVLYREVFLAFVVRYLKIKYTQTLLGIGWAVLQPLAIAATLALLLGRIAHVPSEGLPYLGFALMGMVPWTFFSSAIGTALDSIVRDQGIVRKVYFPREILPLAAVAASVADLVPALLVALVIVLLELHRVSLTWLLLPLPVILLVMITAAVSLVTAAANVLYRDIRYLVPFVLQFGLIASPIAYSAAAIRNRGAQLAYESLNPVAAVIDALRRVLMHDTAPDWLPLGIASLWAALLLLAAYAFFRRLERLFADRA